MQIATNAAGLVVAVIQTASARLDGDVLYDGPYTLGKVAALHTVAALPDDWWPGGYNYDGTTFAASGKNRPPPPELRSLDEIARDDAADRTRTARNAAGGQDPVTWAEFDDALTALGFE